MTEQTNLIRPTQPIRTVIDRLSRIELSTQILFALLLGIGCGIFFGELCGPLSILGDVFVGLLQMTVLPYIGVTLVASLGRLTWQESRRLAWIGGIVLVVLWTAGLLTVAVLPLAFPPWSSGSFFSTTLLERAETRVWLDYFVPANVFAAFSDNRVPAVVLFCICAGVALAKTAGRDALIGQLDTIAQLLLRISKFITRLAPLGILAIAASTAGTVSLGEFLRLQAYLVAYTGGAVFLGVIVLPLLVTTLTPLTYRQVLWAVKEPVLTAFATGKLVIVLPMLVENTEKLLKDQVGSESGKDAPAVEVMYSTAYPFPNVGKLLTILFIPFAAWFLGKPLSPGDYPELLPTGVFASFGGPLLAIPYLLDQMRLPHDMFQLFLISGVFGGRLGDAVGAIHLATLTLISSFGFRGGIRFALFPILKYLLAVLVFGVLMLIVVRLTLDQTIATAENRHDAIARMQLLERSVNSTVSLVAESNPEPMRAGESLLKRIRRRGVLRVGFNEDKVPFAFFNDDGELVGYDINMAHALARDLGVELEFVRFDRATLIQQLNDDHFDVVMSGLAGTLERSEAMHHTRSYLDLNLALVVPDYRAHKFKTLESTRDLERLKIGFVDLSRGFVERLREAIPNAELSEIGNNREFFEQKSGGLDALLISAESGSAFTLMFPNYEVVVPQGLSVRLPLFYAIAHRSDEMRDFLEHWITLRRKDGTAKEYYDHWVLGRIRDSKTPRWCIIRDVLHWI